MKLIKSKLLAIKDKISKLLPKFDTLRLKMPVQVLKILVFLLFYILRTCRTCNIMLLYGGTIWLE